jgi:hypothetical protein
LKGVEKIVLFLLAYHHIPKIFHRNIPKNQEKKNYKQKLIGRRKPENFSEWTNPLASDNSNRYEYQFQE